MGFTFAHPAVVLPFRNIQIKYLDFTSIVIGTMAPDFEYFIHFRPLQIIGHTLLGQVYFNLPIIIFIAMMYHYLLKEAIIVNLPKPYCYRYHYLVKRRWSINSLFRLVVVCYSGLLGALTHLVWDSFTHRSGFFVLRIGMLSKYFNILGIQIPIYKILQHGSTLIGFIVIMICLYVSQDKTGVIISELQKREFSKVMYWLGAIIISIIVLGLLIIQQDSLSLGGFIVKSINSVLIGLVIMSIRYQFQKNIV